MNDSNYVSLSNSPHEINLTLNQESLATLLRSNLSCHLGKNLNQELLGEITQQIIDSIDYFLNKKEGSK